MTPVSLTPAEILSAAHTGIMRQTQNLKRNRKPAYGATNATDWQWHVEGALGECAVAKALGLYWTGNLGNLRATDVGRYQVRTRSRHDYDLILHPEDPDDDVYFLVTGLNGRYRIHGWILGRDGKRDEYWSDPAGGRPAYFVPQAALESDVAAALLVMGRREGMVS